MPGLKLHLLIIALVLQLLPHTGHAQERILSFNSDIQIQRDSTMLVTETIRVRAEGVNIRRGIFRDFPTDYTDRLGNAYKVGFEMVGATRNGAAEDWRVESLGNGVRVYLGNANVFLSPGEYTYTIQYETNRQLGFFENHDELYWNVTGNGWDFFIEQVSATVTLPEAVSSESITMEGYTGPFGAVGQNYTTAVFDGGAEITGTQLLRFREGLTLVMTWPKGIVEEPGALQQAWYILTDNMGLLLSLLTLGFVLVYMFKTWSRVGRDPATGVIFPRYEPPKGYSPASARYISRMNYDIKTLTAAIVNLAVKGYLSISKAADDYTLIKGSSDAPLASGEKYLMLTLFKEGNSFNLDQENRHELIDVSEGHRKCLRRHYFNKLFFRNTLYLWPSMLAALVMFGIIIVSGKLIPLVVVVFIFIALLHIPFGWLLKAPSEKGRLLLDKLEGFKMYLEVAEKDEMNLRNPPEKTPELFEQYLPFAIALDVEQEWVDKFAKVFDDLITNTGKVYRPTWYHGSFDGFDINNFASDVGKGFSSAISSASSPPGSSSGSGGGGSSGGGGGGGGGGGW